MLSWFRKLSREIGAGDALLYSAARFLNLVSLGRAGILKYYIVAQAVPDGDMTPTRRGRQIVVTEVDHDTAVNMPIDRPRNVIDSRFNNGCRCLVAQRDGQLMGYQWFSLHDYYEDEVRCLFQLAPEDRCAWDFDIFVRPEYRVQPVFSRLWDKCNSLLRDAGIDHSLSRIGAFNPTSRNAHERIGAQALGWATFFIIGPLQLAVFSMRPWIHVSFRRTSVPVLAASKMLRAASIRNNFKAPE